MNAELHASVDPPNRRILLASSERDLYGGELQLLLLADGLRSIGFAVVIFARADGKLLAEAADRGHAVHPFDPGPAPRSLLRLRREIRRLHPDVVHCNDPRSLTSVGVAATGLPIRMRSVARRVLYRMRSPLAYRMLAQRVLCVSEAVRAQCLRAGIPQDRLLVVADAVSPERYADGDAAGLRRELEVGSDVPLLLTVASLQPAKGHTALLESMSVVWDRHPDTVLALAGEGPRRSDIARHAAHLGGRVALLGYRTDIPDLLAAADLFALPSLQEGLGSALLEAVLAHVPAVGTSVGAIPDLIGPGDDGPAGWVVPAGDPAALGAALAQALDDPAEAERRARRAATRAGDRFAPARLVHETLRAWGIEPPATA